MLVLSIPAVHTCRMTRRSSTLVMSEETLCRQLTGRSRTHSPQNPREACFLVDARLFLVPVVANHWTHGGTSHPDTVGHRSPTCRVTWSSVTCVVSDATLCCASAACSAACTLLLSAALRIWDSSVACGDNSACVCTLAPRKP